MGKSNRIRTNRAHEAMRAPSAKKQKKGMPGWLMTLITVVLAVALLLTVALSVISSYGLPNRIRTSVKTENYRISVNMMSYYFHTTYQSFQSDYESYLDYFSLDTSKSLKKQTFGGDPNDTSTQFYDTYFLGSFTGTWFDYFVSATVAEVKSMMLYLEEAAARGITLTEEEKDSIEASLDSSTALFSYYGYSSENAYIADIYGKGVRRSDVLKAMEYSTLYEKTLNVLLEELDGKITDDRIQATYDASKKDFDIIDYTFYSFRIDYEEIAEEVLGEEFETLLENNQENQDKVLAAYKEAIAKAKADAEALSQYTDAEEFKMAMLQVAAAEAYADLYESQSAEAKEGTLTDENKKLIEEQMIAEALAKVLDEDSSEIEDEDEEEETATITVSEDGTVGTAYGISIDGAYAEILQKIQSSLDSKVSSALTTYIKEKATFIEDDEFSDWAYGEEAKAGTVKVITEGDGAKDEITVKDEYTYVSAYLLRTVPHADDEKTRDVLYALFSTEEDAQAAIDALKAKETLDEETFETVVDEAGASGHNHIEDCYEGLMESTTFDAWLFADTTKVGGFTSEPLALDDSTYCVAYYDAEGEPTWKVTVSSSILTEDYEAYVTDMEAKYSITVKDNSFKKIDA